MIGVVQVVEVVGQSGWFTNFIHFRKAPADSKMVGSCVGTGMLSVRS